MNSASIDTDTPAIRRAKARLAEEPGSDAGPSGREDIEAAGRGTVEHSILCGIYSSIDRRSDNRVREQVIAAQVAIAEKISKHRRERPARWAALSDAQRLCYWVASMDEVPSTIQRLLTRVLIPLLGRDLSKKTPPSAFEEQHWDESAREQVEAEMAKLAAQP